MPSVKIVFRSEKTYRDGTSPVMLRVIASRKAVERQLCKILPDDWNPTTQRIRKGHPKHRTLNALIAAKFAAAEKLIHDEQALHRAVVAEEIIEAVMNEQTGSFTGHFRAYIKTLHDRGLAATAGLYASRLSGLLTYAGGEVAFGELTERLLNAFIAYSRERGRAPVTIKGYLSTFRAVWKDAVRRKLTTGDPFAFVNVKVPPARKTKLTPDEIAQLENLVLPERKPQHHARKDRKSVV